MTRRVEPFPCTWVLPDPTRARRGEELLGIGADLAPGTLLEAYRTGLFPMHVGHLLAGDGDDDGDGDADGDADDAVDGAAASADLSTEGEDPVGWWSPDPRGILPLEGLHVSRSLRRSQRRFVVTVDTDFDGVVEGCGDPGRDGGWIDGRIREAYAELHELGWAHSVETRTPGGDLVGGLYGVEIGGLFAGESMFSRATDASKVALVGLVERLREGPGPRLLDVQWRTDHLATLGVVAIDRRDYLRRLHAALALDPLF